MLPAHLLSPLQPSLGQFNPIWEKTSQCSYLLALSCSRGPSLTIYVVLVLEYSSKHIQRKGGLGLLEHVHMKDDHLSQRQLISKWRSHHTLETRSHYGVFGIGHDRKHHCYKPEWEKKKIIAKITVQNGPLPVDSQNEQGRSLRGLELRQQQVGEEPEKYYFDTELLKSKLVWPRDILVRDYFQKELHY